MAVSDRVVGLLLHSLRGRSLRHDPIDLLLQLGHLLQQRLEVAMRQQSPARQLALQLSADVRRCLRWRCMAAFSFGPSSLHDGVAALYTSFKQRRESVGQQAQ